MLAPGLKAAVHAVNLGEVFLDKKLRCALTAVAVIAIDNQSLVGIGGLDKCLKIVIAKMAGTFDMTQLVGLLVANIGQLCALCQQLLGFVDGNTFEVHGLGAREKSVG